MYGIYMAGGLWTGKMSLFQKQNVYCNMCGGKFMASMGGSPLTNGIVCGDECIKRLSEKYACYVLGKLWEESDFVKKLEEESMSRSIR